VESAEIFRYFACAFEPAPSMTRRRERHTATLLTDGRVLVAGGEERDPAGALISTSATAELYDPPANVFAPIAAMSTGRANHTATLLIDGRVLITGGEAAGSAEIFDPVTGVFTLAGPMVCPRSNHTATLLPDGTVLVLGGDSSGSAERFDPSTGLFSSAGAMSVGRSGHAATMLASGQVLIVGGDTLGSAELFDPIAGTFVATGSTSVPSHTSLTATPLPGGEVLVLGELLPPSGFLGKEKLGAEIFGPALGEFRSGGRPLRSMLPAHQATPITGGWVLVTGVSETCSSQPPSGGSSSWSCSYRGDAEIYVP
jgi:hypothetical protein